MNAMNRRQLFNLIGAAAFAAATGEIFVPERKIFLPPRMGWPVQSYGHDTLALIAEAIRMWRGKCDFEPTRILLSPGKWTEAIDYLLEQKSFVIGTTHGRAEVRNFRLLGVPVEIGMTLDDTRGSISGYSRATYNDHNLLQQIDLPELGERYKL